MYHLSALPTEVLVLIFKSQDHLADVLQLSSTSLFFHDIWISNRSAIFETVIQNEINSYLDVIDCLEWLSTNRAPEQNVAEISDFMSGLKLPDSYCAAGQVEWEATNNPNGKDELTRFRRKVRQIYLRAREAERNQSMASTGLIECHEDADEFNNPIPKTSCRPHVHEKTMHSWYCTRYFVKLYLLSYVSRPLRATCGLALKHLNDTQAGTLWEILEWVYDRTWPDQ